MILNGILVLLGITHWVVPSCFKAPGMSQTVQVDINCLGFSRRRCPLRGHSSCSLKTEGNKRRLNILTGCTCRTIPSKMAAIPNLKPQNPARSGLDPARPLETRALEKVPFTTACRVGWAPCSCFWSGRAKLQSRKLLRLRLEPSVLGALHRR